MKYDYLKGSEKDFEGAPEWCTHISKSEASGDLAWESADRAIKGNRWQWVGEYGAATYDGFVSGRTFTSIIAERRPITEPVWDGAGLPPAGVECEYELYAGEWIKCRIEFVGRELMIVSTGDTEFYCNFFARFRPIRSPEDVARGEAIKAMREVLGHAAGLIEVSNIYRAIAEGKIPGVKLEIAQ